MSAFVVQLRSAAERTSLRGREWLITNGLGGYASGTLADVATRRYHGMFISSLAKPRGRYLLISRLDTTLQHARGSFQIGGGDSADGHVPPEPKGLSSFEIQGNSARWVYEFGDVVIERRIVMPRFRNTLCVQWRLIRGGALTLTVRPYLPFRRQDAPLNKAGYGTFQVTAPAADRAEFTLPGRELLLRMQLGGSEFVAEPLEARDQLLQREQLRGYECLETAVSPGFFRTALNENEPACLIATTQEWAEVDFDVPHQFEIERKRNAALLRAANVDTDPFAAQLVAAADQFLILPESRSHEIPAASAEGHPLRTVIAGYHWFGDWGRDTMISLEGLMLATRRYREARATLLTFASYIRDGLLPNLFPEGAREGLYHTVDATLWYFHALNRYLKETLDDSLLVELLPAMRSIMEHHLRGTRFGIHADPVDGMIVAAAPNNALTWMDAHLGEWIVTPRRGKPVEIQALWYNALRLMQQWETVDGVRQTYADSAARVRVAFNSRFWNAKADCLYDVIDGAEGDDASIRPNQVLAISLDYPVLDATRWRAVINQVERRLLTPLGLRTLDPADFQYHNSYHGDLSARDAAYHQGTVWPWLMGPFIDAVLRVDDNPQRARALLAAFPAHLHQAGLGSISEVFDGDAPHGAHGCIAQAWSVAEILRAWLRTAGAAAHRPAFRRPDAEASS